jgi:hypothetical protein
LGIAGQVLRILESRLFSTLKPFFKKAPNNYKSPILMKSASNVFSVFDKQRLFWKFGVKFCALALFLTGSAIG